MTITTAMMSVPKPAPDLIEAFRNAPTSIISDNLARLPGAVGLRPFHRAGRHSKGQRRKSLREHFNMLSGLCRRLQPETRRAAGKLDQGSQRDSAMPNIADKAPPPKSNRHVFFAKVSASPLATGRHSCYCNDPAFQGRNGLWFARRRWVDFGVDCHALSPSSQQHQARAQVRLPCAYENAPWSKDDQSQATNGSAFERQLSWL
jgi:hypothetical protein